MPLAASMSSIQPQSILIIGGGVFGLTTALELRRRRWRVTLLDPGPIPRDVAASTDLSKVVRMDYGADELYTALGEAALAGWDLWNTQFGETLYHEDGFLVLSREAMQPGGFEWESFQLLQKRGQKLERVGASKGGAGRAATGDVSQRETPHLKQISTTWANGRYADGYLNPRGGWAASGRVVTKLAEVAQANGVVIRTGQSFARLLEKGSKVVGVRTADGEDLRADVVLVAAGAWTPMLLPHLAEVMWPTGQPVFHFQVDDPQAWQAPDFPVWAADIGRTGWYGFPALDDGTLKIANHGPGRRVHPDEPRVVLPEEIERCRLFLRESLPALANAPLISTRLCLYCDTFDGHFWMDRDAQRPGLVVAAGDNGHAFKFAPVLGGIIADVVEGKPNPFTARFAARPRTASAREGARAKAAD
jgi:sarcosine oxidase / L-pipecolate oxidase